MARPQVVGEDIMDSVTADVFNNQSRTGKKMRPWNFVADLTTRLQRNGTEEDIHILRYNTV
jgi:hypothetical protein